ncbi:dihydrofolate reductase family protein [Nocardia sp. 2]|uniref:Dihydrofolate reductase family protein n=2 Tax=Nocardia acididurans TaxID=2802282 RepID=A0ABS1MKK8_9NOCA|nr:dihydrofolate reductase family protein [Nocardia acididurans]
MQISLDGIADTQDATPWPIIDEELHAPFLEELCDADVFIHGRRTYELMASFWPTADTEPAISEFYIDFARCWKKTAKLVVSRTLDVVDWNTRVVRGDPVAEIAALRTQPDCTAVVFGGLRTAATLMRHGLVDDYQLFIHPVILGDGEPLLAPSQRHHDLELVDTSTYDSGVVRVHYRHPAPH